MSSHQDVGLPVALERLLGLAAADAPAASTDQPLIREELTDLAAHLCKQVACLLIPHTAPAIGYKYNIHFSCR